MEINSFDYPNWTGKTILIGEDELVNYRLLEVILAKTNAKLIHGKTGYEALQLFLTNPKIDLVLIDIKMPTLDGCEVTREIRKLNTTIPIIAQTAYALEEEKDKSIEAGCNAYVTKPINRENLLSLMESLL